MSNAKSVTLQLLGLVFQNLTVLASGIYIARTIGPSNYGVSSIIRNLFQIITILSPLGLEVSLQKYIGSRSDNPGAARIITTRLRSLVFLLTTFIACLLVLGGGDWINNSFYHIPSFGLLLTIAFVALPFQTDINILGGIYRGHFQPTPHVATSLFALPFIRLILIIALLVSGYGLEGVIIANAVSVIMSGILLNIHYKARLSGRGAPVATALRPSWAETLAVMEPSLWMAASIFLYSSIRMMDVIVLGMFRTTREVGEYGATATIAQFIQFFPNALAQTLGPTVALLFAANNLSGVRDALNKNMRLASILSAVLFAGVAVWGSGLSVIFGKSFNFQFSISFTLALGYYISGVAGNTGFALSMTGRHRTETLLLIGGNVLALSLCLLLVPSQGQIGAAIAVCLAYLAINVARTVLASRRVGGPIGSLKDLVPPLLAMAWALPIYYGFSYAFGRNWITFLISGLLYVIVIAATFWVCLLNQDERDFLRARIKRT